MGRQEEGRQEGRGGEEGRQNPPLFHGVSGSEASVGLPRVGECVPLKLSVLTSSVVSLYTCSDHAVSVWELLFWLKEH